ncbi:hypothetical protein FOL47_008570 [Perkinsus chesapeaki]|uniref:Chitinase n=1 Tax=Perkinsus chesapeaki TaxID=330153 RepID=A0A7J6LD19_PERCH|nr:hypothetical protein FOL47_008570 [Perkinsus chesapeaki]
MFADVKILLLVFNLGAAADVPFYKGVLYPWAVRERQFCFNDTLCPQDVTYTWDWFFNTIRAHGVKRFLFGGFSIVESKVTKDPPSYPQWNKRVFANFKQKVSSVGGSIWLELGEYFNNEKFDESVFRQSAKQFIKDYSVDGFLFNVDMPSKAEAAYKVLSTVKSLGKTAILQYWPGFEETVKKSGLGAIADYTVIYLSPYFGKSLAKTFNTNAFAIRKIRTAMNAGANARNIILRIPLIARADYATSDVGYASVLLDMHADPKGNGSRLYPPAGAYYFFSQPRAVEKVDLVRKMSLGGIMIDPAYSLCTDMYPWDKRSIFHALAQAVKA